MKVLFQIMLSLKKDEEVLVAFLSGVNQVEYCVDHYELDSIVLFDQFP